MESTNKGSFRTNFGFLMAAVGSAVGLGNIWGFPYKMGANGGFAFLLVYILMAIVVGYPLMLAEVSLGRKTGKGAIEAYKAAHPWFKINGVFATIVPFLLLCFYCVLGGMVLRYAIANFIDIFGADWGVHGKAPDEYFGTFVSNTGILLFFTVLFLLLTSYVVFRGIEHGIEKVCEVGMPLLALMLIITDIRCCTLPGASSGLKFMFKPDFSVFEGIGWFNVFATAGSQMFFSISLASGALIAFGSYMKKDDDIEKSSLIVPFLDTIAALLAGLAVIPAVFAAGLEPSGGPGLLFVSLQTAFDSMGSVGPFFGTLFYLLVFVAAFSSSICMMEGGVSAVMDWQIKKGKGANRFKVTAMITVTTLIGATLVAIDQLGGNPAIWKPFGLGSWLDVFDLGAEGILMPLGGMICAILFGWVRRGYLDDEILKSSQFQTQRFVNFCLRYIIPPFMALILFVQICSFFLSNTAWFQALMG